MTRPDSRIRSFLVMAVAAAVVGLGAAAGWEAVRAQGHSHMHGAMDPGGWYKRRGAGARGPWVKRQFRGFETTMAEVAYRYTEMYFGALDGNWDYAGHMGSTLATALTTGLERRPPFRKNADALILNRPHAQGRG